MSPEVARSGFRQPDCEVARSGHKLVIVSPAALYRAEKDVPPV